MKAYYRKGHGDLTAHGWALDARWAQANEVLEDLRAEYAEVQLWDSEVSRAKREAAIEKASARVAHVEQLIAQAQQGSQHDPR